MSNDKKTSFEDGATEKDRSLIGELTSMLKQNKKYWMIPLVLVLVAFGILLILGTTAAAPFIYTLF
jgi:hypothetical protein